MVLNAAGSTALARGLVQLAGSPGSLHLKNLVNLGHEKVLPSTLRKRLSGTLQAACFWPS